MLFSDHANQLFFFLFPSNCDKINAKEMQTFGSVQNSIWKVSNPKTYLSKSLDGKLKYYFARS